MINTAQFTVHNIVYTPRRTDGFWLLQKAMRGRLQVHCAILYSRVHHIRFFFILKIVKVPMVPQSKTWILKFF